MTAPKTKLDTNSRCEETFTPYEPGREGVQLNCNNSGGHWWLEDKDEAGLTSAGWLLVISESCGRHVDYAFLPGANIAQALTSFRDATSFTGKELGCSCCGTPFCFQAFDASGKMTEMYSPEYPKEGEDYS